ncbi:MAG: alpha/beta fold hydrolase [Candidatus Thorarchaeota archaeon]
MSIHVEELREKLTEPYHLLETSDGVKLFLRIWSPPPQENNDIAILIFHGITAHSGPYSFLGEPISKYGFTIYGLDLRGHGLSDGNRGDSPGRERFVKDLCETISYLKKKHTKVILLGHSLGVYSSVTAMNYCLDKIDGAILLSAGRTISHGAMNQPSAMTKLKILFSSIFTPSKPVVEYRREGMVGLDDPLFTFNYTLRFIRMLDFEGMGFPQSLSFPVFVSVGENDELFSVESVRGLFDLVPAENKEFSVIANAKHAVFPEGSWNGVLDWLKQKYLQ